MNNLKMHNNHYNNLPRPLTEGLEYKDMEGLLKPTIHVDEFDSKMGDNDDVIVISFFVRDKQAARDLVSWFEKGYDFVLDADRSPGEIRPGRYLVYVEIRRRSSAPANVAVLLNDLGTLTEHESESDWTMHYRDQELPFSEEDFARLVPTSPREYRLKYESDLNEVRTAAGLPIKSTYEPDADIRAMQSAAGIL
jgi:hypothetical protein